MDPDLGDNSVVIYSVPEDSAFRIDPVSGLIKTKVALDFEENQVHYVVVTAKDGSRYKHETNYLRNMDYFTWTGHKQKRVLTENFQAFLFFSKCKKFCFVNFNF